jgi:hypothetical protein
MLRTRPLVIRRGPGKGRADLLGMGQSAIWHSREQ